jgi:hypothetical protein
MSLLRHCTNAVAAFLVVLAPGAALAQQVLGAAPAQQAPGAPAPHSGFQMALRTGVGVPFGNTSGAPSDGYSQLVSAQVPLMLDIGGKLNPHFFLGAYLGLGFGGAGNELDAACAASSASCGHVSLRLGAQLQYNVAPAAKVNPWVGYGIGIEGSAVGAQTSAGDATIAMAGFELARLMGGVDFRMGSGIGVGPFLDLTLGRYSNVTIDDGSGDESFEIRDKALHGWLTLGVRFVLFP